MPRPTHAALLALRAGSVVFVRRPADREPWRGVVSDNLPDHQLLGVCEARHVKVTPGARTMVHYRAIVQVGEELERIVIKPRYETEDPDE